MKHLLYWHSITLTDKSNTLYILLFLCYPFSLNVWLYLVLFTFWTNEVYIADLQAHNTSHHKFIDQLYSLHVWPIGLKSLRRATHSCDSYRVRVVWEWVGKGKVQCIVNGRLFGVLSLPCLLAKRQPVVELETRQRQKTKQPSIDNALVAILRRYREDVSRICVSPA